VHGSCWIRGSLTLNETFDTKGVRSQTTLGDCNSRDKGVATWELVKISVDRAEERMEEKWRIIEAFHSSAYTRTHITNIFMILQ